MSTDPKGLAAEIEAVTVDAMADSIRRQVVLLRFNEARTLDDSFDANEIDLLCIRAANAVKDHVAAEVAALRGRAFEDGARWMRESAAGCATAWRVRPEKAFRAGFRPQQVSVRNNAADHIATAIQALPLQPEGERNA